MYLIEMLQGVHDRLYPTPQVMVQVVKLSHGQAISPGYSKTCQQGINRHTCCSTEVHDTLSWEEVHDTLSWEEKILNQVVELTTMRGTGVTSEPVT